MSSREKIYGNLKAEKHLTEEHFETGTLKGSFTVETAAIFPVIFLVVTSAVYLTFFFHDKYMLQSTVIETASIASERMRLLAPPDEEELTRHFQERIRGKMIYFPHASVELTCAEEKVTVVANSLGRRIRIRAEASMNITLPEREVRKIKHLKEMGE